MWKIPAGIVAVILIAVLIFMNTGDKPPNTNAAMPAAEPPVTSTVEPAVTPALSPSPLAHRVAPVPSEAAHAASTESIDMGKPIPTKMSTTGTTFVLPKGHERK